MTALPSSSMLQQGACTVRKHASHCEIAWLVTIVAQVHLLLVYFPAKKKKNEKKWTDNAHGTAWWLPYLPSSILQQGACTFRKHASYCEVARLVVIAAQVHLLLVYFPAKKIWEKKRTDNAHALWLHMRTALPSSSMLHQGAHMPRKITSSWPSPGNRKGGGD